MLVVSLLLSRLEQIANTPEVRRSPRLSQRLARREDTFLSITHSATLRPSLKGYNKPHEVEPLSVLNESGQSVPLSFDMDDDNRSKNGDHSEHTATGLPQHLFGELLLHKFKHLQMCVFFHFLYIILYTCRP